MRGYLVFLVDGLGMDLEGGVLKRCIEDKDTQRWRRIWIKGVIRTVGLFWDTDVVRYYGLGFGVWGRRNRHSEVLALPIHVDLAANAWRVWRIWKVQLSTLWTDWVEFNVEVGDDVRIRNWRHGGNMG